MKVPSEPGYEDIRKNRFPFQFPTVLQYGIKTVQKNIALHGRLQACLLVSDKNQADEITPSK